MEKVEKDENPEKKSLFSRLYDEGKDLVKKIKKPHAERALKRKFEAAYDDAQQKIEDAEAAKLKAYEDIEKFDINTVLRAVKEGDNAREAQAALKSSYKEMFDQELEVR